MTTRNPNPMFSEVDSGLIQSADRVHERNTNVPTQKPTLKTILDALQRLSESVPSEAEAQRLAADYAETPDLFAADSSAEFALALAAQRSTADGGLANWLDALDRGSQHRP